jgi:hypothetical protein
VGQPDGTEGLCLVAQRVEVPLWQLSHPQHDSPESHELLPLLSVPEHLQVAPVKWHEVIALDGSMPRS